MLSRPFLTLAVALFAASMGIGMVAPILPVHARALGASGAEVGLTFSAFAATQLLISPFAGRVADRYGRKPFILAGLSTYVIAAIGWSMATQVETVIALRAMTGIGSGLVFSLALAVIGDLAPEGEEGRYMGTFGVFDFLGFGLGPAVAGVIRDQVGMEAVFLSMAALMALAGLVVAALLPRRVAPRGGGRAGEGGAPVLVPWRTVITDPLMQALFALRTGFSFAFGAAFSFLALYLQEQVGATATMVGLVLAGQELTAGLLQPLLGPLADRWNRRLMALGGALGIALAYIILATTNDYLLILAAFVVVAGLGASVMNVAAAAVQVEVGRRLGMATTMSLASAGFALGTLAGSLIGGVVADRVGVGAVFGFAAAAILAGAAVFALRTRGHALTPHRSGAPASPDAR